jgi:alkylated DNA repair protein (DNA oxidative demethylase)
VSLWDDHDGGPVGLAPGAVLLRHALDLDAQRDLVEQCRVWSAPPAGMRVVRMPNGAAMTARQVCLGWHWYPYRYSRTVDDGGGEPVKAFPPALEALAVDLAAAADPDRRWWDARAYEPDLALVNFYDDEARMGLHQDADERSPAPVVSISLGDTATFRFGNTENRKKPWQDVELGSGDVVVFGGPARMAYHGVLRTRPGTAPAIGMDGGRFNITVRESGLGA